MAVKIAVKVINQSTHNLPQYATQGASGMDLKAHLPASITVKPLERILVPTGLFLEIPEGYEAQVRTRSGMALHHGIVCLNSPGTIDADYRGEIKVILINLSGEEQLIKNGDRIAQLVFQQVTQIQWEEVNALNESIRGAGGFGHTGKE